MTYCGKGQSTCRGEDTQRAFGTEDGEATSVWETQEVRKRSRVGDGVPGIKPRSLALQADSLLAEPQGKPIAYAQLFGQDSYLPGSELGVVNTEQREMFSGMTSNKQTSAKTHPVCGCLFKTVGYIKILHSRVMHMFSIFSPIESLYIGCQKNYCKGTAHTI